MFADQEHYAGEVVTNFNQFGRIMPLNQADIGRDKKADPAVGTRLEDGNVSWPARRKHRASARPSLTSGAPLRPTCSTTIGPSSTTCAAPARSGAPSMPIRR